MLPSLTEGLPLSVLEAMAHALPVVATPVGGIPEVITDGQDGLLVPVNQPEELARVLSELLRDHARRQSLGETGYRHVRDRFSFERMAGEYEEAVPATARWNVSIGSPPAVTAAEQCAELSPAAHAVRQFLLDDADNGLEAAARYR